jgi:hypothetical protein
MAGKNKAGRVLLQEIQEKVGATDENKIHTKIHNILDFSNITNQEENSNTRHIPTYEIDRNERETFDQTQTHDDSVFLQRESYFEEDNDEASGFKDENDDNSTPERKVLCEVNF